MCKELETIGMITYPGDKVSAGGGCEAVVTARTSVRLKLSRYGELPYVNNFPPTSNGT